MKHLILEIVRKQSLKELLAVLLKVNNSNLSPEYRAENSVNPVSRRLADISKAKKICLSLRLPFHLSRE
jgi:hypothetical protein